MDTHLPLITFHILFAACQPCEQFSVTVQLMQERPRLWQIVEGLFAGPAIHPPSNHIIHDVSPFCAGLRPLWTASPFLLSLQPFQRPISLDKSRPALAVWLGPEAPFRIVHLFTPCKPFKFTFDVMEFAPDCGFCHVHIPLLMVWEEAFAPSLFAHYQRDSLFSLARRRDDEALVVLQHLQPVLDICGAVPETL